MLWRDPRGSTYAKAHFTDVETRELRPEASTLQRLRPFLGEQLHLPVYSSDPPRKGAGGPEAGGGQ